MPIVNGLEQEYNGRILFVRANIHNQATIALQEKLGFTATPEFFLLDEQGNILEHWDDDATVPRLKLIFDERLKNTPTR